MEDKILDAISEMSKNIDLSNIDKIEISFTDGIIDVNIESNESPEQIAIREIVNLTDDQIELKAMMIALLMSEFKKQSVDFLKSIYKLLKENERWVDALNMFFEDIAKNNHKNYFLKVIKS